MTTVQEWMTAVVQSGSWKTFDDLHIDEAVPGLARTDWLGEAKRLFVAAAELRTEVAPGFAVVLGFGLDGSDRPIKPSWPTPEALLHDLDDSPPSLYLFDRNSDQWQEVLGETTSVECPAFLPQAAEARYREVPAEEGSEYSRSLLLVL